MHYGAVSDNQDSFDKILSKSQELPAYLTQGPCTITEFDTYYDYVKIVPNVTYQYVVRNVTFTLMP